MKYRLLALDLDGTLFSSDMTILPETRKTIKLLMRKEMIITLATGRPYTFAKEVANELSIEIPLITHDGALVASELSQPLSKNQFSHQITQKMIEIFMKYQIGFELQLDPYSIVNVNRTIKDEMNRNRYQMLEFKGAFYIPDQEITAYLLRNKIEAHKISLNSNDLEKMERVKGDLLTHLSEEIDITYAGFGMEILPKGISKGYGLKVLSSYLKIKPSEIIVVGDNYNDLEMFRYAGLSVAMANAPQEVKDIATFVTLSNDEEGIAHAIQSIKLEMHD